MSYKWNHINMGLFCAFVSSIKKKFHCNHWCILLQTLVNASSCVSANMSYTEGLINLLPPDYCLSVVKMSPPVLIRGDGYFFVLTVFFWRMSCKWNYMGSSFLRVTFAKNDTFMIHLRHLSVSAVLISDSYSMVDLVQLLLFPVKHIWILFSFRMIMNKAAINICM